MTPQPPSTPDLVIATPRQEIVFILDDVGNHLQLAAELGLGREVVILDATRDGLQQIAQVLEGRSGIDALHVISHGSAGAIGLGSLTLDSAAIAERQEEMATIRQSLAADADILLYGCDAGADAGLADALAIATGADVALSDDRTGHAALEGDWDLEVSSGSIETDVVVDAQLAGQWHEVLALTGPTTITFDNYGNFTSPGNLYDPGQNPVYRVNGNPAYQLVIDGAQRGAVTNSGLSAVYAGTVYEYAPESAVTLSFQGGQLFTASSLQIENWGVNSLGDTTQTFLVRGYAGDGSLVGSTASITLTNGVAGTGTLNFTGMTDIQSLKITAATNGGNLLHFALDNLVLSNIRSAPPEVVGVTSSTANGAYKVGDVISLAVNFDQAVNVTGTPQLTLETGTTDRVVNYSGGSGSSTLTFQYTVQAGDTAADLDLIAFALNGGSIRSLDGTDANLTLPVPGGIGSLGANKNIAVDGIAPTVVASTPSHDLKAGETATVTFTFSEAVTGFTLSDLDFGGGTLSDFSGSGSVYTVVFTPTPGVNGGSGWVSLPFLTYTDAAGNTGTSAGVGFQYDTLAPAVPSVPDLAAVTDTGRSNTDNITAANRPTFTGTAEALSLVQVYDGASLLGTVQADASGAWSLTPVLAMAEGTHSITARTTDNAGNSSGTSAALTVTIDTTASVPGTPDLATASDTGASSTDNVTGDDTPTITGTAEAGATVTLYDTDGTTVLGSTLAGMDGTWSITSSPLGEGIHSLTARIVDLAGNTSAASSPLQVTIDRTAPSATTTSIVLSTDTGASQTDFVTSVASQTVSGVLSAPLAAGEYVQVSADGGASWMTASAASTTWSIGLTLHGSNTLQARVMDAAGNAGPVLSRSYTLDQTAPTVAITSDRSTVRVGETATIRFTFSEDPGGSFTFGDIAVSGGELGPLEGTGTVRTAVFTPTPSVNGGTASITVGAGSYADVAGNLGAAGATPSLVFDTLAPAAPSALGLHFFTDTGSALDGITQATRPMITGIAEANSTVRVYVDGTLLGTTCANGAGDWLYQHATALAEGTYQVTARAVDAAGNESAASPAYPITIDHTAPSAPRPVLAGTSDTGASDTDGVTQDNTPTITGTAEAGATITLQDGGSTIGTTTAGLDGTWSLTTGTLADGTQSLRIRVTDVAGNQSGLSSLLTVVVDTLAPAASSAPDLAALSDTGLSDSDDLTSDATPTFTGTAEAGSLVTLYDGADRVLGTAYAGEDGTWEITSILLDAGTHQVYTRATDLAGNTSAASATTTLQVDLDGPTTGVVDVLFSADTGASSTDFVTRIAAQTLTGTLSAALAADEAVQVSLDGGSTWNVASASSGGTTWSHATTLTGPGTLLVRVVDAFDRTSEAVAVDYVLDTAAPNPGAPVLARASDTGSSRTDGITTNRTPTITGTAEAGAAVTLYGSDGSTVLGTAVADGAGAWTITSSALADGIHQLTARATDLAGNTSNASAPLQIQVDREAATVRAVGSPDAAGVYGVGDVITINVRFTEKVVVTGTPQLLLETGAVDRVATYVGGSGTGTISFQYTVQAGDSSADLDYRGTGALRLEGGTIRDLAGNNAKLALAAPGTTGSLGAADNLRIDALAPAVQAVRVDGTRVVLQYDEELDRHHLPALSAFQVLVNGATAGIDLVRYNSRTQSVVLELDEAVTRADVVKVTYRDASGDQVLAIQDTMGNDAASLAGVTAVNMTPNARGSGGAIQAPAGELKSGQLLSADLVSLTDADGVQAGTVTYQWLRDGSAIAGAQRATYRLGDADSGARISLEIGYQDGAGMTEKVLTAKTSLVGDNDGVSGTMEAAAPGLGRAVRGDGNGDGVLDRFQGEVASKVLSGTVADARFVTLVAHDGTITGLTGGALPANGPAEAGLGRTVRIEADVDGRGALADFSFYVGQGLGADGFWLQDRNGQWREMATDVVNAGGKTRLDFTVRDGSIYDHDGMADGFVQLVGVVVDSPV